MSNEEKSWEPWLPLTCNARLTPFTYRSRSKACAELKGNPCTITPLCTDALSCGKTNSEAICLAKTSSL